MTIDVWLNKADQFVPGAELFRSDRPFRVLAYSISHSQLLLSSDKGADGEWTETTVHIMFKPVEAVQIQECYRGLVITHATSEEAERIDAGVSDYGFRAPGARVFLLKSQGIQGYVVSRAIGWHEAVLPRMQSSFFHTVSAYELSWPTRPVGGLDGGLNLATPAEVATAFLAGLDPAVRRDRHRYVHALIAKDADGIRRVVGIFLAESDATEAADLLRPKVADCWIEQTPMVL